MIIPERKVCDICGADCDRTLNLPMIADCRFTEGVRIAVESIDICEECLKKVTKIRWEGSGSNPKIIDE